MIGAAATSTGGVAGASSPLLLSATLALFITNAATLWLLWKRRSTEGSATTAAESNDDSVAPTDGAGDDLDDSDSEPSGSVSAASPSAADATNTSARLSAGASQPTSQCFRSVHIAHEGTARQKSVRRTVYCRDTNDYLRGIRIPTPADAAAASAAASSSAASSSSDAAAAAVAADSSDSWVGCSVITSVPDVSETGLSLAAWRPWFRAACASILARVPAHSCAIFYQTDIKVEGRWVSKAALVMQAAESLGIALVWHKIVVVNSLGTIRGSTAGYVHLLCFSREHREDSRWATPDLLAHRGSMMWKRAMGLKACEFAVRYLALHVPSTTKVIDPFCGSGSILATANAFGLHSEGVDHSRKRCALANELKVAKILEEISGETTTTATATAATGEEGADEAVAASAAAAPAMSADEIARRARKKARKETRQAKQLTQRQQQQLEREEKHAKMRAAQQQQLE